MKKRSCVVLVIAEIVLSVNNKQHKCDILLSGVGVLGDEPFSPWFLLGSTAQFRTAELTIAHLNYHSNEVDLGQTQGGAWRFSSPSNYSERKDMQSSSGETTSHARFLDVNHQQGMSTIQRFPIQLTAVEAPNR